MDGETIIEKITVADIDYEIRRYLKQAVSDILRGIVPPPKGPSVNVTLDQILEGKRKRPSNWPALVVIDMDGFPEVA